MKRGKIKYMDGLKALDKIDTTICIAFNTDNDMIFGKDPDDHADCNDIEDYCDAYESIKRDLTILNLFKKCIVTRSQVSNGHGFDYFVHIMDKNHQEVTFRVPKKQWEMIGQKINERAKEKKTNGKTHNSN